MRRQSSILLVDDEPDVVSTFVKSLRLFGFEVVGATDPLIALQEFANGRFDIVVSDIRMPKMDGLQLARKIRDLSMGVKLVLTTAFETDMREGMLKSLRIDELIKKPINGSVLASAISRLLSKEILDTVYICRDCKSAFLFLSDIQDHNYITTHKRFYDIPLEEAFQEGSGNSL